MFKHRTNCKSRQTLNLSSSHIRLVLVLSQCKIHQYMKSQDHLANDCTNIMCFLLTFINILKYFNVTHLPLFTPISFTNKVEIKKLKIQQIQGFYQIPLNTRSECLSDMDNIDNFVPNINSGLYQKYKALDKHSC